MEWGCHPGVLPCLTQKSAMPVEGWVVEAEDLEIPLKRSPFDDLVAYPYLHLSYFCTFHICTHSARFSRFPCSSPLSALLPLRCDGARSLAIKVFAASQRRRQQIFISFSRSAFSARAFHMPLECRSQPKLGLLLWQHRKNLSCSLS